MVSQCTKLEAKPKCSKELGADLWNISANFGSKINVIMNYYYILLYNVNIDINGVHVEGNDL